MTKSEAAALQANGFRIAPPPAGEGWWYEFGRRLSAQQAELKRAYENAKSRGPG